MAINTLQSPLFRSTKSDGTVNDSGYVYVLVPGGNYTVPADRMTVWSDKAKTTVLSQPIQLDSKGEKEIWFDGTADIRVEDSTNALLYTLSGVESSIGANPSPYVSIPVNGSFEVDTDDDGAPDNWTLNVASNGTIVTDTDSAHGAKCLKFTGTDANGGGTATSDKFDVLAGESVDVTYTYKSSAVDTHNKIDINWYTGADALVSSSNILDESAANPASYTTATVSATVPPTAVKAEIVLSGVLDTGTTTIGNTQFDNVVFNKPVTANSQTTEYNKTIESPVLNTQATGTAVKDEDDMASDSAVHLATQQSIKAYVDSNDPFVSAEDDIVYNNAAVPIGSWVTITMPASYSGKSAALLHLNAYAFDISYPASTFISVQFRGYGDTDVYPISYANTLVNAGTSGYNTVYLTNTVLVRLDASRRFQIYVQKSGTMSKFQIIAQVGF